MKYGIALFAFLCAWTFMNLAKAGSLREEIIALGYRCDEVVAMRQGYARGTVIVCKVGVMTKDYIAWRDRDTGRLNVQPY